MGYNKNCSLKQHENNNQGAEEEQRLSGEVHENQWKKGRKFPGIHVRTDQMGTNSDPSMDSANINIDYRLKSNFSINFEMVESKYVVSNWSCHDSKLKQERRAMSPWGSR